MPRLAGSVIEPFALETFTGAAAEFHAHDLLQDRRPRVVLCRAKRPALVLGSRQSLSIVDVDACHAAGVDVVKRRSGGGVVLVEPDGLCWFDVVVPADDARFAAIAGDVTASMVWIGRHIVSALTDLGVGRLAVHPGPMSGTRWSELVCFAGVGPGEGLDGDRKLVGISQRRTRLGSRFQCMVHTRWSPSALRALLAPPRPDVIDLELVATVPSTVAHALPGAVAGALTRATG